MKRVIELRLAGTVLSLGLLAGCSEQPPSAPVAHAIEPGTACALDGMLLAHFPGPKAQIHFKGDELPEFFCDTVEMFSVVLNPEQARMVTAILVQDMGAADWESPRGHWIDARSAFYVVGSSKLGSMGPTIGAFAADPKAAEFAQHYGGRVLRFGEVSPEMVVLDGGVMRDQKM
ncbi:MAG: nitrous oxide reductase accessory protein NosL [Rhodocyclaceae bacterium]|nr:nitrous oxide reductase accessory protein NosL [Rhodocyclaceae bacterium]